MKSAMESGLGIVFDCCSKEALLAVCRAGRNICRALYTDLEICVEICAVCVHIVSGREIVAKYSDICS